MNIIMSPVAVPSAAKSMPPVHPTKSDAACVKVSSGERYSDDDPSSAPVLMFRLNVLVPPPAAAVFNCILSLLGSAGFVTVTKSAPYALWILARSISTSTPLEICISTVTPPQVLVPGVNTVIKAPSSHRPSVMNDAVSCTNLSFVDELAPNSTMRTSEPGDERKIATLLLAGTLAALSVAVHAAGFDT